MRKFLGGIFILSNPQSIFFSSVNTDSCLLNLWEMLSLQEFVQEVVDWVGKVDVKFCCRVFVRSLRNTA